MKKASDSRRFCKNQTNSLFPTPFFVKQFFKATMLVQSRLNLLGCAHFSTTDEIKILIF
jgi:hypothetical protein